MVKVFGKKFKKAVGSSIKFLFELLDPENFAELDRQIYEMNNPFRLRDFEFLLTANYKNSYEVKTILEDLRKKAEISGDMILGRNTSLEAVIRKLVPKISKEKVEYIRALREAATGKLDIDKYTIRRMIENVGPNTTLSRFSMTNSDGVKHVLYDKNRGIGTEDIDFKKVLRYKGLWDLETVENTYCKLYEPKEQRSCKYPQRKCINCSVYHGFKGSGRLYEQKIK